MPNWFVRRMQESEEGQDWPGRFYAHHLVGRHHHHRDSAAIAILTFLAQRVALRILPRRVILERFPHAGLRGRSPIRRLHELLHRPATCRSGLTQCCVTYTPAVA